MMARHTADPDTETRIERLDRLRGKVRASLQEYLEAVRGADDGSVILDWAAAIEYSNPEAEVARRCGRMIVCEDDRISQSAIQGLGLFMSGMAS